MNNANDLNENTIIFPPPAVLQRLGITQVEVENFPSLRVFQDIMGYSLADATRKYLVGNAGTNLQMLRMLAVQGATGEAFAYGQVVVWLCKNRLKPTADTVAILKDLLLQTALKLGEGDIHAVNRRHRLIQQGIVNPAGTDIVPAQTRRGWIGARGRARL